MTNIKTNASKVYLWKLNASRKSPFDVKLKKLCKKIGLGAQIKSGDLVAIKMHFGEVGTTAFIPPLFVRPLTAFVEHCGGKPFLTDTNTLYMGERGESVSHTLRAAIHGFSPFQTLAPVIIADGLKSNNERAVNFDGKHFKKCYLAGDILDADYMITLSHAKAHEVAGFGGALKNIAMGCATRKGKMQQHACLSPAVHADNCTGCGDCLKVCKTKALRLIKKICTVDATKCVGCAACLPRCRHNALTITDWFNDLSSFLERMAEYCAATLNNWKKPLIHFSFVTNVTPACDCAGFSDMPICPDIGILVSTDPVAIDQAAFDLINQAPVQNPILENLKPGDNKFAALYPKIDAQELFEIATKFGLGNRSYKLEEI